jgi:hypothetical protein
LHEEEAFFCGTDDGRAEAGRAGCTGGRGDTEGWDQRATFYRWKKQYVGMETDQVDRHILTLVQIAPLLAHQHRSFARKTIKIGRSIRTRPEALAHCGIGTTSAPLSQNAHWEFVVRLGLGKK